MSVEPVEYGLPDEPQQVLAFEGEVVTEVEGRLPSLAIEMDSAYPRGTILRLQVEVRVRNVRHDENRRGELTRTHVFALESVGLVAAFQPHEALDTLAGSASAHRSQTPDEAEDLGLRFARSSQTWGA